MHLLSAQRGRNGACSPLPFCASQTLFRRSTAEPNPPKSASICYRKWSPWKSQPASPLGDETVVFATGEPVGHSGQIIPDRPLQPHCLHTLSEPFWEKLRSAHE